MIDPIALTLGPLTIKWYGIMMALGLIGGYLIFKKVSLDKGIDKVTILEYYLVVIITLFIGTRLFHALVYNPSYFLSNPIKIFSLWEGGLSSHGGIIGGSLGAYIYCKRKKLPFYEFADLTMIAVAFAAGCVRIGNFLNSELVGKVTTASWGIKFQGYSDLRHPSQLYEAAKNFLIAGILYKLNYIKSLNLPQGFLYWLFIFLFSFFRFFTEFYKEYLIFSSGLSIGQWISILFTLVSGYFLVKLLKTRNHL